MADTLKRFAINGGFWGVRQKLITDTVVPYQERVLNDKVEGAEKSHAVENFTLAAEKLRTGTCGEDFYGMVFQDSDVAKWLEAAAYSLLLKPDAELEKRCDEMIALVGSAQQADGYLNTYFTVKSPEKKWTNLQEGHELYCAGHMIEAGVAYYECTGKKNLLDIVCAMADCIYKRFVTDGVPGWPGHPEAELALMKLYGCTGEERYRELAQHFLDARGTSDYYIAESEKRQWTVWGANPYDKEYTQSHLPVREQTNAVGHAVRAVYLYTGMAEAAKASGDEGMKAACRALWSNLTGCRMYVTGAIGSAYEGEAFTKDYHLPNDTAYAETCAAIGLVFFAKAMLELDRDGKYADVMERALYNCVLAGMELDGTKFFYVNQLENLPGISGEASSHPHTRPQRPKWFTCACCPPNAARLIASLGRYAWSEAEGMVYSDLFVSGTLDLTGKYGGKITVETDFPLNGTIRYVCEPTGKGEKLSLAIRLPRWSRETKITLNGAHVNYKNENGYAVIADVFGERNVIGVELDIGVRMVYANPKVASDSGKAAFTRGPLVYCAEGADNGGNVLGLYAAKDGGVSESFSDRLCGIVEVEADGFINRGTDELYSYNAPSLEKTKIKLIPYYAWANRGINEMRVWLPVK